MKLHLSKRILLVLLITTIIFSNCKKEEENPCDTARVGENYMLSDSIVSYIFNYADAQNIIFKTAAGEEVIFTISDFLDYNSEYLFGEECEVDTTQVQSVTGTAQTIELSLSNPDEIDQPIVITLFEFPFIPNNNTDNDESLSITLGALFSNDLEAGDQLLYFDLNAFNNTTTFSDSLQLLSKTFYSVFEPKNLSETPTLDIKYTQNEGIVYIKNNTTGRKYIYDRKE